MHYDVFNGDADGIIALLQLRLAEPKSAQLVTGVKRDIQLLDSLNLNSQDSLTVLDISMSSNQQGLANALQAGADVFYVDHHKAGDIPSHANLNAHIDLDAETCTALIVDALLQRRFHLWAITAAYGDNLLSKADTLALQAGLSQQQAAQLQELGTLINYNGYGEDVEDLHFHPAELFQKLLAYDDPFAVIADKHSPYYILKEAYAVDMTLAQSLVASYQDSQLSVFILPDTSSSRRVSGVYGNWLANQAPNHAHLVLTLNSQQDYTVSLRAPLTNKQGAGELCSQFASGGGREAAGGINHLPKASLELLIQSVSDYYQVTASST
ncbi:DHH family phosphoesterase [Vibrio sp. 404]|uniref:DHH family phosphoesterase n=1 Tax=Vibrio marinisediminis TaxID=2758441 RepID=A0A7W2FUJ7_9VIBR|nr:DHH family phosphoesterase [Vibrio marinisediminis]MBA5764525.1 DHH family phosphoesterase [Vibrio marinisediminis]